MWTEYSSRLMGSLEILQGTWTLLPILLGWVTYKCGMGKEGGCYKDDSFYSFSGLTYVILFCISFAFGFMVQFAGPENGKSSSGVFFVIACIYFASAFATLNKSPSNLIRYNMGFTFAVNTFLVYASDGVFSELSTIATDFPTQDNYTRTAAQDNAVFKLNNHAQGYRLLAILFYVASFLVIINKGDFVQKTLKKDFAAFAASNGFIYAGATFTIVAGALFILIARFGFDSQNSAISTNEWSKYTNGFLAIPAGIAVFCMLSVGAGHKIGTWAFGAHTINGDYSAV